MTESQKTIEQCNHNTDQGVASKNVRPLSDQEIRWVAGGPKGSDGSSKPNPSTNIPGRNP